MSEQKRKKKEFKIDLGRSGARKLSGVVQRHAFDLGYRWADKRYSKVVSYTSERYLGFNKSEHITFFGGYGCGFLESDKDHISVADFLELKEEDTFAGPEIEMVNFYNPVSILDGDLSIKDVLLVSVSGYLTDGKVFKRLKEVKLWGDPVATLPVDKETRKVVWERVDKE